MIHNPNELAHTLATTQPMPDTENRTVEIPESVPRSPYSVAKTELFFLGLTIFYYTFLVFLGVCGWIRARICLHLKHRKQRFQRPPHFEIGPNQLHIRFVEDDDSM
ncbi:unnamed protein product [Dicrocoelium dendriticum]|nr:unnamed protein product [Dicrocoelium dendriticum]